MKEELMMAIELLEAAGADFSTAPTFDGEGVHLTVWKELSDYEWKMETFLFDENGKWIC